MSKTNPLLHDKAGDDQLQLILKRNKYRGEFQRMNIHEQYKGSEWLQRRVGLADLYDLVDEVEKLTNKFIWSRIAIYANLVIIASAFVLFGVGISNHYYLDQQNNQHKEKSIFKELSSGVANFWDLSWPFFVSLLFLPLASLSLFFINRIILSVNMNKIAALLRDENVKKYESRNLFWEIGVRCKYLKLALIFERSSVDFENSQYSRQDTSNPVLEKVIDANYIKKIPDQPLDTNPNLNTFEQQQQRQINSQNSNQSSSQNNNNNNNNKINTIQCTACKTIININNGNIQQ